MKTSSIVSAAMLHLTFAAGTFGQAQSEVIIDTSFDAAQAQRLEITVSDADIDIQAGSSKEIAVEVSITGRDLARGREYFELHNFDVRIEDGAVRITSDFRGKSWWTARTYTPSILVAVWIPDSFTASVRTADGDVAINRLAGDLHIKTSDGDIAIGQVDGYELELRTADGDIAVESARGESIHAQTADGDIAFGEVQSARTAVRTSDGDITFQSVAGDLVATTSDGDIIIRRLETDNSTVRTTDGDISIDQVKGNIVATGSDSDISVELLGPGTLEATTSDGDIAISLPERHTADIKLWGEDVYIAPRLNFSGTKNDERADGQINGGGGLIVARTRDGSVHLRAQKD